MLESPRVRRLINIAGRWQLLSRLAGEVSVLADARWEAVLLRTQSDTARAVLAGCGNTPTPVRLGPSGRLV